MPRGSFAIVSLTNAMKSRNIYLLLAGLFVLSVAASMSHPASSVARGVAALPAVAAVVGALFQLFRDQLAFDRAIFLQASQNSFTLGATSHMAIVAFDKHVSFSEEYVQEVFSALQTLFREGPSDQALPHAHRLYQIRQKWALWITPAIEADLERFEGAIRTIGADAHVVDVDLAHPERSQTIRKMYDLFKVVMGKVITGQPATADHAIENVIIGLRRVLGIEELTDLRQAVVRQATKKAG